MAEYNVDRVGESAHIGNNEAGKDININTFNIIQLPTSGQLHVLNERLDVYSQCPFLETNETNTPPQDRDLRNKIQKFKLLISACRQRDDINQDLRHALSETHKKLDDLGKRFGEPVAPNLCEHSPGPMSPIQVTSGPATPIPTTPGPETPCPAALNSHLLHRQKVRQAITAHLSSHATQI